MSIIFTSCTKLDNGVIINQELKGNKLYTVVRTKWKVLMKNNIDVNQVGIFNDGDSKLDTAMNFALASIVDTLGYKKNIIQSRFYSFQLESERVQMFATIIECMNHRRRKDYEVYITRNGMSDLKICDDMNKVVKMLKGYSEPKDNE